MYTIKNWSLLLNTLVPTIKWSLFNDGSCLWMNPRSIHHILLTTITIQLNFITIGNHWIIRFWCMRLRRVTWMQSYHSSMLVQMWMAMIIWAYSYICLVYHSSNNKPCWSLTICLNGNKQQVFKSVYWLQQKGETSLMIAVKENNFEAVQLLVRYNADVFAVDHLSIVFLDCR
jgi:hypothetical protein